MRNFWRVCWAANIAAILYILIAFFLSTYNDEILNICFRSIGGIIVFYSFGILSFLLWVYCLLKWNKVSKNPIHLVLLIFLTSIYTPLFYYSLFIKKQ
jgi:hypothetical protein